VGLENPAGLFEFSPGIAAPCAIRPPMLAGNPGITKGGRLTVLARPPAGLTDAAGVALDRSNQGKPGNDATFVIALKGSGISR
jgi:hypothetical protein